MNEQIMKELLYNDLDFIAFVISPFHALGVDAFVYDLFTKYNRKLNGLIFVYPHPKNGALVEEHDFICTRFSDVKIISVPNLIKSSCFQQFVTAIKMIKGSEKIAGGKCNLGKKIYIISVMNIAYTILEIFENENIVKKYSPQFILVDEGIGAYFSKNFWTLTSKYDQENVEKKRLANVISDYLQLVFYHVLDIYFTKDLKIENRCLFFHESNSLIQNLTVIESYKSVLLANKHKYLETNNHLSPNRWAIIATQPFVEYNQVGIDDYTECIKETIKFLRQKEILCAIKPHPRENSLKYDVLISENENTILLDKSISLEKILYQRPNLIIGFTSTALVTAKIFYDIFSVSIMDKLMKKTKDPLLEVSRIEFKDLFGNIVCFKNLEEITIGN